MKEVKPMKITDTQNDRTYILEFDKDSVRYAESRGFDIDDIPKYPLSKTEELFWYAFRKNHKSVDLLTARKLLEGIGTITEDFVKRLIDLYSAPLEAFTDKTEDKPAPFVTVE